MDPTANLREQIELAAKIIRNADDPRGSEISDEDAVRLAELVQALHGWISGGGFLPDPWQPCDICHGHGGSCSYCHGTGMRFPK